MQLVLDEDAHRILRIEAARTGDTYTTALTRILKAFKPEAVMRKEQTR